MRIFSIALLSFLIISCKSDKQNKLPKKHNPYRHIEQNIENEKAIELYYKGLEFFEKGNFESATESFNKSFEIEKSPIILNELGTIELAKNDYPKAIKYFNQGRKLDNYYWPVYINEARSLEKLSEFEEAEKVLLRLKKLCESDYWVAYADYNLAVIYFNARQGCDKVYEFLENSKSMASDPELNKPYLNFKNYVEKNCG